VAVRVGLDVGGTKCLGVAVAGGEVVAETRVPSPRAPEALLDTLADLARSLVAQAGGELGGVGVGAPGLVDRQGVLRVAPNLKGVEGVALRGGLEARLGVPVQADNDATCAAWGEARLGAGKGLDDMVMVTLGTGIGGGVVAAGRLCRGANGFAGEVGHMVVDTHGPPCPCGQRGCWERYASGSGLARLAREAAEAGRGARLVELAGGDPAAVRGEHVAAAVSEGDTEAAAVLAEAAWWLGLGLANLANILDPEAFVVGGGLVALGPALLDPAAAAFAELVMAGPLRPPIPLLPASLGERAGGIGAAFL
jgi:glucokinase